MRDTDGRCLCSRAPRNAGQGQRARSHCGVEYTAFHSKVTFTLSKSWQGLVPLAPTANSAFLNRNKHIIPSQQADDHLEEQVREHLGGCQLLVVFNDVPAEIAFATGHAEHQFSGDQRAPGKRPTHFQTRRGAREDVGNRNRADQREPL